MNSGLLRVFVVLFALLSSSLPHVHAQNADDVILKEMNAKLREIKQRALTTDDPAQRIAAQQEIMQVMKETVPKLTTTARPMFVISMQVLTPLQTEGEIYTQMIADWVASGESDFATLSNREEIARRIERIERLSKVNESLLVRFNNFEDNVMEALKENDVPMAQRRGFLEGLRESMGKQIGPLRAIRTIDRQLFVQYKAAYELLDRCWGKWSKADDGMFRWENSEDEAVFQKCIDEILSLAEKQAQAEQLLSTRL